MQPLEIIAALVLAAGLSVMAARAGGEREAAAQVRHDVAAAAGIASAYRGLACARGVWTERIDEMARQLGAVGIAVKSPGEAVEWRARYPGGRAPGAHGAPVRTAGVVVEIERRNAGAAARRTMRAMGGRLDGTSMVVTVAGAEARRQRMRRSFIARRGTSSC